MADVAEIDRTTRFCRRLDDHIASLPDRDRLPMLIHQQAVWIERYSEFCRDVDAGRPRPNEQAVDYVLTIAEIGKRITKEESRGLG